MTDLLSITHNHFEACRDATFQLRTGDGGVVDLKLTSVDVRDPAPPDGGRQGFSLVFEGPAEPLLPQQTYQVANAEIGELEIFLVPIGQDAESTRYEAVFS